MNLYIANCTQANQRAYFRLDFDAQGSFIPTLHPGRAPTAPRHLDIPSGQQRPITNLSKEQIGDIIDQLTRYGMRAWDYKPAQSEGVVPQLWREDKPIPEDAIMRIAAHNRGVRTDEGKARREAAAIASHQAIVNLTDEMPDEVTVEFEQEREEGDNPKDLVAEGIRVRPNLDNAPPPVARGRRKAA